MGMMTYPPPKVTAPILKVVKNRDKSSLGEAFLVFLSLMTIPLYIITIHIL